MTLSSVSGNVGINFGLSLNSDAAERTQARTDANFNPGITLGTGDNQVNIVYLESHTITNGVPLVLNIQDGSLKDFEGTSVAFTKVRSYSINTIPSQATVSTTAWTLSGNFLTVNNLSTASYGPNGGSFDADLTDGFTVTVTSADTITIANDDVAATLTVLIGLAGIL